LDCYVVDLQDSILVKSTVSARNNLDTLHGTDDSPKTEHLDCYVVDLQDSILVKSTVSARNNLTLIHPTIIVFLVR